MQIGDFIFGQMLYNALGRQ